ncbi:hypothetical protein BDY21DRAFT_369193 [Lineolata rhizophorae]|uniref:FAD-binding PCMH-type domain-containing protein n=1 Tax=Lineolata rhizophorae TaxID=578093 RepID=A0A6A6PB20_9PEZI|nr:hypothetical protein BDY21DRAFT_369193 [Lineolata rhizophorae]
MANAVLSTLHHVTDRKLRKLAEHQAKFISQRALILAEAEKETEPNKKVQALLDGIKKHGLEAGRGGMSVKNVERFLNQSRYDPSVTPALMRQWENSLLHDLEIQSLKYDYAELFGKLLTEWIQNQNPAMPASAASDDDAATADADSSASGFEPIGREEMHEQRKQWETFAFTLKMTDTENIRKYLTELFATASEGKFKTGPLNEIRKMFAKLDESSPSRFDSDIVVTCIDGVLREDLFAGKKRQALVDLRSKTSTVLREMADVLNMDLDSLDTWQWEPSPVRLNMRRQLSGKYRVYMDEEIHQAIFCHFIGMKFAVYLKKGLGMLYDSPAWHEILQSELIPRHAQDRREYFLGANERRTIPGSVWHRRKSDFRDNYFLTQLPDHFDGPSMPYDDDDDIDKATNQKAKGAALLKEQMFRLATTEMLINKKVHGQFCVWQSDFKWYGPSLAHSTIYEVLRFFGVPTKWLAFFRKFLQTPLAFSHDGPDAVVQVRKCGVPMSHMLSNALSEPILFCLDYAINQRTEGGNLYRLHDDLWYWGQEDSCQTAWTALDEFANVMGLSLNEEKTGSALVLDDPGLFRSPRSPLPQGPVRWGFLILDAKHGRWIIDQKQVDQHIEELRRQLGACRSVLAWVQAWNSYVSRFFSTNFGQAANCLGRQHIDMVIETFKRVQKAVFAGNSPNEGFDANVTDFLRSEIEKRFNFKGLPDGFFYLPAELGGLELRNPFITFLARYEKAPKDPVDDVLQAFETDKTSYERAKNRFHNGDFKPDYSLRSKVLKYKAAAKEGEPVKLSAEFDPQTETFMGLDEYVRFREHTSRRMGTVYEKLLEVPEEAVVAQTPEVDRALSDLAPNSIDRSGLTRGWNKASPYWKWIVQLYAGEVIEKFAGLSMGEKDMLPIGLLEVLRSERISKASKPQQMEAHREAVSRIAATVRAFHERQQSFRIYHGSTNSTRMNKVSRDRVVDTSGLNRILSVDASRGVAVVEPNVPMDALVAATLPAGRLPPVVMEFPGITVGGGFAGTAGESSSFKYGLFDCTIGAVEMVLGDGEVVRASRTERRDLFYGAAGTCGTLGVVTLLEVDLREAGGFVELEYRTVRGVEETLKVVEAFTRDESLDFVDAIMFSAERSVVMTGVLTAAPSPSLPVQRFTRAHDPWFYMHADRLTRRQRPLSPGSPAACADALRIAIPTPDYLFRYDRGAFWGGAYAFRYFATPFNRVTRYVLDGLMRARPMYAALHASGIGDRVMAQDVAFPFSTAGSFIDWVRAELGIFPLWLCPLLPPARARARQQQQGGEAGAEGAPRPPAFYTGRDLRPDAPMLVNVGVWGMGPRDRARFVAANRAVEAAVRRAGGLKCLYAHAYYTEDEFWQIYDAEAYGGLRRKYRAEGLPSVFEKVRVRGPGEGGEEDGKRLGWVGWVKGRLWGVWPFNGLYGVWRAVVGGDYLLAK